jgi:hypothetical protein
MDLSRLLGHGTSVSPHIFWPKDLQGDKLIKPCLLEINILTNSLLKSMLMTLFLETLAHEFYEEMKQEFEMSMIGELNYFLGLQVKQTAEGIFISQSKYAKDLVKRFGLDGKSRA